ncbi:hypothetical protein BD779DRAFT_1428928, partial [Infundibulicybe gibba]
PGFLLRYCSRKVRNVIEEAPHWSQRDWAGARAYLLDLYGSNDRAPRCTPDKLRRWSKRYAGRGVFNCVQDVDRYYREFISRSNRLLKDPPRMLESEVNILFYRGIPAAYRFKIKRRLSIEDSPPTIEAVLALLRREFDKDDIDYLDSDSSDESSELDSDEAPPRPKKK